MLKIGSVQLIGGVPRVVLGVDGKSSVVAQAANEGVDILEIRVDQFEKLSSAFVVDEVKVLKRHALPLIGTIRSRVEGGKAEIEESHRLDLYRQISPLVDAIDIDLG